MLRCSLFVLLVAGCGDNSFCVEDQVSITQGLYGLVWATSDVGPPKPAVRWPDSPVEIQGWPSRTTIATAQSDADGIFEIPLEVGTYALCNGSLPEACVVFDLAVNQRVRADKVLSIGAGGWSLVIPTECD
jgi:hypothetical protein